LSTLGLLDLHTLCGRYFFVYLSTNLCTKAASFWGSFVYTK
jgi:hypothetical protein